MKISFAFVVLLAVISCAGPEKKETMQMPGAYKMLSQNVKGIARDTTYTSVMSIQNCRV